MLRCPNYSCNYVLQHITHNLYECPVCGYVLIHNQVRASIHKTDLRVCKLIWHGNIDIVLNLRQLDILKLMKMCENISSTHYTNKLKLFIRDIDKVEKEITNLNRILPRIYLDEVL